MLINENLVYLQLQKTGSTHIAELIKTGVGGQQIGKHQPLHNGHDQRTDRLIVGSIRDPLDWYVSLWGYTCSGRGELYDRTAGRAVRHSLSMMARHHEPEPFGLVREINKKRSLWSDLYSDPKDTEAFQAWLEELHSLQGRHIWKYGLMGIKPDPTSGLYTHWFRRCYYYRIPPFRRLRVKSEPKPVRSVQSFVRLEHLVDDLSDVMERSGFSQQEISKTLAKSKDIDRNASSRKPTSHYFDDDQSRKILDLDREVVKAGRYSYG